MNTVSDRNKNIFVPEIRLVDQIFISGIQVSDASHCTEIMRLNNHLNPEIVHHDPTLTLISSFENAYVIDVNGLYAIDMNNIRAIAWQIFN